MPLIHDAENWQQKLAALPLASYGPRETVIAEGTNTGRLLILKQGAVSIVKGGTEIATVAEPGAVFGELSALLGQPHSADVRTLEASEFHVADAAALLGQDPVALLYVTILLARRLDGANQLLLELKNEIDAGAPPGLLDKTIGKLEAVLSAIGTGYMRAGAGYSMFPPT
jgi:CRP/FNR family cyclic AMP-dependent transcriptional regulator